MDTTEAKDKLLKTLKWDNIVNSLPLIALIGGGILIVSKVVDIGTKLAPLYKKVERWNKDAIFEIIDTVGDNIQILDIALKALKLDLSDDQLKKLADTLQNIGTAGKHMSRLWDLIMPSLKGKFGSGSAQSVMYKES